MTHACQRTVPPPLLHPTFSPHWLLVLFLVLRFKGDDRMEALRDTLRSAGSVNKSLGAEFDMFLKVFSCTQTDQENIFSVGPCYIAARPPPDFHLAVTGFVYKGVRTTFVTL